MSGIYLGLIELVIGCLVLSYGANKLIHSASLISKHFRLSPIVIGMVLMGFGTSLPELVVSILATVHGSPVMAVGNAIGSNITNFGLVMGCTALIRPLLIRKQFFRCEFPMLGVLTVLAGFLLINLYLSRLDAIILLAAFAFYLLILFKMQMTVKPNIATTAKTSVSSSDKTMSALNWQVWFWLFVGFVMVLVSADVMVNAAVKMAYHFGLSELVIGLTVVAVGTALPEIATTIASVLAGQDDLAVGNILGSCIFNLLVVLAMPGLIHPTALPKVFVWRDFSVLLVLTMLVWCMAYFPPAKGKLSRMKGGLLVVGYCMYILYLLMHGHVVVH